MNVGQLKQLISKIPDDTPIVVDSFDHSYCIAEINFVDAELCATSYFEYIDDKSMFKDGVCVKVLRVGD